MKLRIFLYQKYIFQPKKGAVPGDGAAPFLTRQEANAFITKPPKPAHFVTMYPCWESFVHSNNTWNALFAIALPIDGSSASAHSYFPRAPPLLAFSCPNARNGG